MAKTYNEEDGVWRTVGGRRIFIRNGQSLSDAMKESGKFKKTDTKNAEIDKKENPYATNNKGGIDDNSSEFAEHARKHWEDENEKYKKEHDGKDDEMAKNFAERWEREKKNREYGESKIKEKEEKEYEDYKKMRLDDPSKYSDEEIAKFNELDKKYLDRFGKEPTKVVKYRDEYAVIENGGIQKTFDNVEDAKKFESELKSKTKEEKWGKNEKDQSNRYEEIDSKSVIDSDGFTTDYTMYKTPEGNYKMVFGDKDLYSPEDTEDIEFDNLKEAKEWFNEYKGFVEDEDENQFEVGDLKKKAMEKLPKEDIDTHEGDLYLKKTKESTALLENMKNKDSGLLSTFRDQQTGETWYDIPFANMEDDYKAKQEGLSKDADDIISKNLDSFNDKAKANFGKVDYYGNGRKSNAVEIEMELKDGVFSARGSIKNARGTDSVSGGQNIDEIAELFKDNKDVQEIHSLWKKYHLNNMHAGTEKQDAVLEKYKSERKSIADQMNKGKKYDWEKVDENDYYVTKKLLENHNLLVDDGYQYGTGWLKREIPTEDKKRIIELINKYNGKSDEKEENSINASLRKKGYEKYMKEHPGSKMTFEEFKNQKK